MLCVCHSQTMNLWGRFNEKGSVRINYRPKPKTAQNRLKMNQIEKEKNYGNN